MDKDTEFKNLKSRVDTLKDRKIRVEERFRAAQESVKTIVAEIKKAGYDDPKKLSEIKAKKEEDRDKLLASLETEVTKQEAILASIDD
jgi:hypothetical protein